MAYYRWKDRCGEIWNRVGPSALAVAIVGTGIVGAIQIVQAQDPIILAEKEKKADEKKADEKSKLSKEEREKLEAQLEALQKERSSLDSKMRDLQKKLGVQREIRIYRSGEGAFFPEGIIHNLKDLSPEQRAKIDKEMQSAKEQMKRALEEVRRSQKEIGKNRDLFREGFEFAIPAVPALPVMPKMPEMRFFLNRGEKMTPEQEKAWKERADMFEKQWSTRGPEWERWSRDFEARMQRWAEQFEARMQRRMQERDGKGKPKKEGAPKESSPKSDKFFDDLDVIIGSAVKPFLEVGPELGTLDVPAIVELDELAEKESPKEKPKKRDKEDREAI